MIRRIEGTEVGKYGKALPVTWDRVCRGMRRKRVFLEATSSLHVQGLQKSPPELGKKAQSSSLPSQQTSPP